MDEPVFKKPKDRLHDESDADSTTDDERTDTDSLKPSIHFSQTSESTTDDGNQENSERDSTKGKEKDDKKVNKDESKIDSEEAADDKLVRKYNKVRRKASRNSIVLTNERNQQQKQKSFPKKDDDKASSWIDHDKHFFILSSAGKPIWTRYGDESQLSTLMGVIQAIISFFQDNDDTIKSIQTEEHQIVFFIKGPLYYVAVSKTGESSSQLRDQLLYLHNQILSVLTNVQLTRIFEQRVNFDLRRLLGGTEVFLESLSNLFSTDHSFMLSGLQCLRLPRTVREQIGQILVSGRVNNILYGMIVCKGQLVTLLRPKKHSLHPSDLHLLFNMLTGSTTFHHTAESWTPICLPKFNSKGFLHAYIYYIEREVSIVVISTDKNNFFEISDWKSQIVEKLTAPQPMTKAKSKRKEREGSQVSKQQQPSSVTAPLSASLLEQLKQESSYTVEDTEIPHLLHFLYKSKIHIQFTAPTLPEIESTDEADAKKAHYFQLIQLVYDKMHHRSRPLKLHYMQSKMETVLGWITSTFELFVIFPPDISKSELISSSNQLLRWIKKHEESLFILNAPVF